MCRYTLTIYLCGHHEVDFANLCDPEHLKKVNSHRAAHVDLTCYNPYPCPGVMVSCSPPARLKDFAAPDIIFQPYPCGGERSDSCALRNAQADGWEGVAGVAVKAIKEQTNSLKAEVGNIVVFLSNKQGAFVTGQDTDFDGEDEKEEPEETKSREERKPKQQEKTFAAALAKQQDVSEALWDVLYRYRRLTSGPSASHPGGEELVNKLDNAYASYGRALPLAPSRKREQAVGIFEDVLETTIVQLAKGKASLGLLKRLVVRWGAYTTTTATAAANTAASAPSALPVTMRSHLRCKYRR